MCRYTHKCIPTKEVLLEYNNNKNMQRQVAKYSLASLQNDNNRYDHKHNNPQYPHENFRQAIRL